MRLLITTQTVDMHNPGLGFFHHWLEVFAPRFESIEVICLSEGTHALPANVRVHSLGKEKGGNRFQYITRFLSLVWKLRNNYDAVFVHMNPEYVLLAADIWLLTRKRVAIWYNHEVGSLALRLAAPVASVIFHTSPYAYTARYKKAVRMPAGIDTTLFSPASVVRDPFGVYFQGRVSKAKRVHVLLAALRRLRDRVPASVTVVGPEDASYVTHLRHEYNDLIDAGALRFLGPKKNEETPALYSAHAVAINLTADGNFDKTVLEAAACETPVIVSSKAFEGIIPSDWTVPHDEIPALVDTLERFLLLTEEERKALGTAERTAVMEQHSLTALRDALVANLT